MTEPAFRYARLADVSALTNLIERAYRSPETAGGWDSESHLLTGPRTGATEVGDLIADSDSRFLVAERDRRLLACVLIQKRGSGACAPGYASGQAAYFGMFAVDPDLRGTGLGRRLVAEAETCVRDLWTAPALAMTVISVRAGLIAWYGRRGYALTGARIPFPFDETTGETTREFDLVEMLKVFP
ncbi:MAG: GNAT family N-acetyltransferase [Alphaproteobacteria bacterium]|nr:GNAT family N-acetyltransferase [Alphaproteobacteria bacterium]